MTILMVAFFGCWFCIFFHLFSNLVHLLLKCRKKEGHIPKQKVMGWVSKLQLQIFLHWLGIKCTIICTLHIVGKIRWRLISGRWCCYNLLWSRPCNGQLGLGGLTPQMTSLWVELLNVAGHQIGKKDLPQLLCISDQYKISIISQVSKEVPFTSRAR